MIASRTPSQLSIQYGDTWVWEKCVCTDSIMSHTITTPIYYRVDRKWDTLEGKCAETQVTIYAIHNIPSTYRHKYSTKHVQTDNKGVSKILYSIQYVPWTSFHFILDFFNTEISKSHDPLMSIIYVIAVHDRSIFNNRLHGLWELGRERNNKAIVRFENP